MGVRRIASDEMPTDRSAIEGDGFTATVASFDAPAQEDSWHHHGDHDIIAFILEGRIRIETTTGDTGEVMELGPSDLVHIERGTIHREAYLGRIRLVGFNVGSGVGRVDVETPREA